MITAGGRDINPALSLQRGAFNAVYFHTLLISTLDSLYLALLSRWLSCECQSELWRPSSCVALMIESGGGDIYIPLWRWELEPTGMKSSSTDSDPPPAPDLPLQTCLLPLSPSYLPSRSHVAVSETFDCVSWEKPWFLPHIVSSRWFLVCSVWDAGYISLSVSPWIKKCQFNTLLLGLHDLNTSFFFPTLPLCPCCSAVWFSSSHVTVAPSRTRQSEGAR